MAFKYRTGTPRMDLPEQFGSWRGTHNRLRKWAANGTWEVVLTALFAQAGAEGDLGWVGFCGADGARDGTLPGLPDV
ncbi:transposase [Streptomyces sp. NPDC093250]|uniref:transposase n=1 Tax=Streptomyces sp. NPDC093250 TaxID=3366036 RepID=UPI003803EBC5